MTESAETKVCPACAEVIKAKAHVCPHCRHYQRFLSWRNPSLLGAVYGIFILLVFGIFGIFMESLFNGNKHDFSPIRDRVEILQSNFDFYQVETNLQIVVVGVLTNGGDSSWKEVGLEVQFFDSAGKLIDVISRTGDYGGTAVLKHDEAAFKLKGIAARPQSDYASHKMFVRWAKQADAWP